VICGFKILSSKNLNERSGGNYKEAAGLLWLTSTGHEEALKFFQGVSTLVLLGGQIISFFYGGKFRIGGT
jgi:hypothetical protein